MFAYSLNFTRFPRRATSPMSRKGTKATPRKPSPLTVFESRLRPMKIAVLQHSDHTPAGSVETWASQRGFQLAMHRLHKGEMLPGLDKIDLVVILGGPMNVDDTDENPWLVDEKRFLKDAIAQGTKCVGLCLGGQLLAQAIGGSVHKNKHWEVGWHQIDFTDGKSLSVFQWHQDCFTLPATAEQTGTNSITPNQAFRFQNNVIGFQFHPESTFEWLKECAEDEDFPRGPFVQSPKEIMDGAKNLNAMREWFFSTLDAFVVNWPPTLLLGDC